MRTVLDVGLGVWLGSYNYCTSFRVSRSRLCPISQFLHTYCMFQVLMFVLMFPLSKLLSIAFLCSSFSTVCI